MDNSKRFNLSEISRFRNEMFGLSIISIIVFHYFGYAVKIGDGSSLVKFSSGFIMIIGSIGVEIFLFLSGMGLCFSMKKDRDLRRFYKKRFQRLVIPYLILGLVVWIIKDFVLGQNKSITGFLLDYSLLSFWLNGNISYWFITFIAVMYAVYPVFFKCFDKNNKYRFPILIVFLIVYSTGLLFVYYRYRNVYSMLNLAISRVPIFAIGAYYGERIYNKEYIKKTDIMLVVFGIAIKAAYVLFNLYNVHFPPFVSSGTCCLFSISVVFIYAFIRSKLKSFVFSGFLTEAGALSLELYMTHYSVIHIYKILGIRVYGVLNYILLIIISIISSIGLHYLCDRILQKIGR